ncbi:orf104c (mitochondrion) [Beta vulgaris subsp. vulgaris]|uniref:Orf104c protein n=1 Tax=Beta vulgaris subsp. vulgaris TaxID=3555 RepID=Q9MFB9_BETVV|nr:orf104c [Beta vulgaris subsp. vulgaris]BAA99323.1 orf104c [Beta vulgaris subsp. vulgaris]
MKNEECPAPASTYSYQNEKRDFTLLNKQESPFYLIKGVSDDTLQSKSNSFEPIYTIVRGPFNKVRARRSRFLAFLKSRILKLVKTTPCFSQNESRDPGIGFRQQ